MYVHLRRQIVDLISSSLSNLGDVTLPAVNLDIPADKAHGDFSTNIAMQLARQLKKNPLMIAKDLVETMTSKLANHELKNLVERIDVKAPGFINFYLSKQAFCDVLMDVLSQGGNNGKSNFGQGQQFCLEFVSANPTGPLTVAHGRQAAVGDSLVNILKLVGFNAKKEYYVNDEGNQINILGRSIAYRAREILGDTVTFPEDHYQGEYIRVMAQQFIHLKGIKSLNDLPEISDYSYRQFGVEYLMKTINTDLEDFGVHFDIWSYQSKIADVKAIEALLANLKSKEYVYPHEGALWFKSTLWGDDKDRVVQKSDGSYTYLTPDIVYHQDKFRRGFDRVVNILGPDHHGYIPRIKAAAAALGKTVDALDVIIVQLATIYRNGKEVSMSTRRGEFITLREVIDEVGSDAGRFFFLMRQTSAHLEFDLELAKKQSAENPVYYIQYAHARIHSIVRRGKDEFGLTPQFKGIHLLKEEQEINLIRSMALFGDVLIGCAKSLDPFSLGRYLQELSGAFHKFYDNHRVLDDTNPALSSERLALIEATRMVLQQGLQLLGVNAPEKM